VGKHVIMQLRCNDEGGSGMDMAQPPLVWRKASASKADGNCVELAPLPDGGVAVRDSKDPNGPTLRFTATEWAAFARGLAVGDFDDLIPS
jgi:hypothetical protein